MPSISGSSRAAAGVKAFGGRVGIGSKGPKFRPGTRDGSGGARSPMSFAAGPRSSSRRGNSLEFGGGVVPDDSHSEADPSDSSASPVTPQHIASTDSKSSTASLGQTDVNTTSTSSRHTNAAPQQQQHSEQKDTHARLESIDTLGSFEDFRSLIAFSSPSNLLDESPALTTSTDLSSPEFAAPVAVTTAKDKPLPLVMSNKPQPPIPTPVETEVAPATSSSNHANAAQSFRAPPKRVAVKLNSTSADEPMHLRPQSNAVQRRSTASSLPESVSQPGSSQLASEEFHSPSRKTSNVTDAMRRLEESIQQGPASTAKFGLGIISPEDAHPANNTANRPINNTAAIRNSLSTRRNTKTSSDMSSRSSAESWGRTSFGRDALRMLIDSENAIEAEKPASLASNKTQKTYVSDSGHSTNTAETSTDLHDSDQLSTIKERTESPESVLKRHISMELGLSQSDARTSRISASSARSEAYRTASPEPRLFRTLEAANSLGRVDARRGSDKELTSLSKAAVNGIGSPTFGFRQRKTSSQSSAANELLPPLDLDAPEYSAHGRRGSSASSTYTRKGPIDLSVIAGLRRGSAGVLSSTPGSRLAAEPYTAPLPSLPFPASSSAPLLQASMARSAAQSSEPNTPNLVYEAALAKAVGKQRKSRPAALALNLSALSALSAFPSNGSLMSPNNLAFMGLASPGKPRAPPPSAPPTEPLPPIPNTPSLASKSPNPLQRSGAWNARKATSVATHGDSDSASVTNSTTDANASRSEMSRGDLRDGANSVASCHSTFSSISDRRREILSDKEALLGQLNESTRQEILRRTEGRFAGAFNEVATAFRQLQADKLLLEQIVREKTPLSGVGTNNEQLSNYLSTMNAKLDHSNAEIRKLLDLLEQQREVIEQLLATHQLEKETLQEDVERLHEALTQVEAEAERNRDTVIRLNAELTRAHAATVQANAEAMRARTTLVEESRKREKVVVLLRQAKERLREVETEDLSSSSAPGARGKDDESEKYAELASLRKLLEERDAEIASLRLSHADAVMQESSTAYDASSISHQDNPAPAPPPTDDSASPCAASDEVARLREQIAEQKEREKQIRTAYVYVRDELRKANTDRRRSSITVHHATPTSSTLAPSLSARRNADQEALQEVLSAEKGQGETPVKLKRLSLPIVARASGIHGGGVSPDSLAHPPSSFRSPTESGSATGHSRRHSRQILTR
ncbi:hypothetical protein NDA16_001322 [Ustilago loliicola]|nr:hypothetical protein NDA16_001322 [Ustilago loliicola]